MSSSTFILASLIMSALSLTHYVDDRDITCTEGVGETCDIRCTGDERGKDRTFDCNQAEICIFRCDAKICADTAIIDATNSKSLYVIQGNNAEECLSSATIYTPNYGYATFTVAHTKKPYRKTTIYAGVQSHNVIYGNTTDSNDPDFDTFQIYAETASYLELNLGQISPQLEWDTGTIRCPTYPINEPYAGEEISSCVISAPNVKMSRVKIYATDGIPRGVWIEPTFIDRGSNYIYCDRVNDLNGWESGQDSPPFDATNKCWWTMNPTSDPTLGPTSDPTSDPTVDPTSDPSTLPTHEPSADPTSDPIAFPTSDPTADPTVNSSPFPTLNPSFVPSLNPSITIHEGRVDEIESTISNMFVRSSERHESEDSNSIHLLGAVDFKMSIIILLLTVIFIMICCICIRQRKKRPLLRPKTRVPDHSISEMKTDATNLAKIPSAVQLQHKTKSLSSSLKKKMDNTNPLHFAFGDVLIQTEDANIDSSNVNNLGETNPNGKHRTLHTNLGLEGMDLESEKHVVPVDDHIDQRKVLQMCNDANSSVYLTPDDPIDQRKVLQMCDDAKSSVYLTPDDNNYDMNCDDAKSSIYLTPGGDDDSDKGVALPNNYLTPNYEDATVGGAISATFGK